MKDFKTRILSADYGKRFRQLLVAGICILFIGGGASIVLMHTVDANAFSGPQQMHQEKGQFDGQQPGHGHNHFGNDQKQPQGNMPQGNMSRDGMPHDGFGHGSMHHGGFLSMILHNSQVSIATKIAVLATTILGILWAILTWFTIVCYLYRTSTFSRMNTALWTVLGILFSILALIAFFIARSFVKARCDRCGAWQDYNQTYCTDCGNPMRQTCPACGSSVPQSAAYCASCGRRLASTDVEAETASVEPTDEIPGNIVPENA